MTLGHKQFWSEVLAIFLGDVAASVLIIPIFITGRWFLRVLGITDIKIGYNWSWEGIKFHPNFDIRNSSAKEIYTLANVKYTKNNGKEIVWIDNKSIWGKEIKPGTITFIEGDPVVGVASLQQCVEVEVTIRTQDGQEFKGSGPGQLRMGLLKRATQFFRKRKQRP